mgnify:CR=1 FL=1
MSPSTPGFWIEDLLPGLYTLQEVTAPPGYNLDKTIYEVTVNVDGTIVVNPELEIIVNDDGNSIIKIDNRKAPTLPDTGGIGTLIFTIIGVVLMVGAYVYYRRKQA